MAETPLDILILWHMHQPVYQNLRTGRMAMPWVRLHGTKDYLDMVMLLEEFPDVHVNVNWVPSLLDQVVEYAEGRARDRELDLSEMNPESMGSAEKVDLIKTHFAAHDRRMIERHPRYAELKRMRGNPSSEAAWERAAQRYSVQDLRDLQVWLNLAWVDPLIRQLDPFLTMMVKKGRGFTEEDKAGVLSRQRDILAKIIPTTAAAWEAGRLEVSLTPYYHPILPLLCDTTFARRARPQLPLPSNRFVHPEDAQSQIHEALLRSEALFGRRPRGMWPSEGSVCDEIIPMLHAEGIDWIATDEEVLAMSLGMGGFMRDRDGNVIHADKLYRAWNRHYQDSRISIVFRDHAISDLIGFQFANWSPEAAADALIQRLEHAARHLRRSKTRHAVSIILDGENCWEHYEEDGLPFLRAFYQKLSDSHHLRSVTISQHLQEAGPIEDLPTLHSGSWINHDYGVWIGHAEDNKSWDLLYDARQTFERVTNENNDIDPQNLALARKSLMIAEGSDWNWWYGDEHNSGNDDAFDALYREHLSNVYRFLGSEPPVKLGQPIITARTEAGYTSPRAFLQPQIDGRATSYFEWFDAGKFDPAHAGGAMRQTTQSLLGKLYYGFDMQSLYVRIDLAGRPYLLPPVPNCAILIFNQKNWRIDVEFVEDRWKSRLSSEVVGEGWVEEGAIKDVAAEAVLELAVPFNQLGLSMSDSFGIQVELRLPEGDPERQPANWPVQLAVPDQDFEARMWVV